MHGRKAGRSGRGAAQKVAEGLRHRCTALFDGAVPEECRGYGVAVSCSRSIALAEAKLQYALAALSEQRMGAREFQLISSAVGAAAIGACAIGESERLIFDTIERFDGQERLLVLVVGMDAAGAKLPFARSRIYRAISRAQLQCSVINELVPGGWLEFISHTKLDGAAFDRDAEEKLRNRSAASSMLDKNEATAASFEQSEAESSAAVSPLLAEEGGFDHAKEAMDRDPSLLMSTHEHSSTHSVTVYPSLALS